MVIGGVICPDEYRKTNFKEIRSLKIKNHIKPSSEVKWTKVSDSRKDFYIDLINYFLSNENLAFRAVLVPDKNKLDHDKYGQTHDDFYYKMYYDMLKKMIVPFTSWNVYIDEKDTRGAAKIKKLKSYLKGKEIKIQEVRSRDVELIQLADILLGAIAYKNRGLNTSLIKLKLINLIESQGYKLDETSLYIEEKFNILRWQSREEL